MLSVFVLSSSRIIRRVNIPCHLLTVQSLLHSCGPLSVRTDQSASLAALQNQMRDDSSTILYFVSHSDGAHGMRLLKGGYLDGHCFAHLMSLRSRSIPSMVFFNTCDGVKSGLVEAALDAGIQTVIAADRPIRIKFMCKHAEMLFSLWARGEPLQEALDQTNREFRNRGVRFDIFGDLEADPLYTVLRLCINPSVRNKEDRKCVDLPPFSGPVTMRG